MTVLYGSIGSVLFIERFSYLVHDCDRLNKYNWNKKLINIKIVLFAYSNQLLSHIIKPKLNNSLTFLLSLLLLYQVSSRFIFNLNASFLVSRILAIKVVCPYSKLPPNFKPKVLKVLYLFNSLIYRCSE